MTKLLQLRYFGEGSPENYPEGLSKDDLIHGDTTNYFVQKGITAMLQIGIQTLPGTKFYFNNDSRYPLLVGPSGVYELDIDNEIPISGLCFNEKSLNIIDENSGAYLIIDVIYEG